MKKAVLVLIIALSLPGCPNTSPERVKLTASVQSVALSVTQGSLVTTLSGTFQVDLDVGDLAAGDATIADPPSFELVLAKDQSSLKKLDAVLTGETFPITVKSGEHRTLSFSLGQNDLAAADLSKVCPGPVQIAASLQDSLTGDRPTAFESAPLTPTGCP